MRKVRLRKIRRLNVIYTEKRTRDGNPGLSHSKAYKTITKVKEPDMLKMRRILTGD